jgi:hypothetical protein
MRRALIGGGALVVAYAIIGALTSDDIDLVGVGVFLAAVVVLHDGVFLPLVLGLGKLLPRRLRPAARVVTLILLSLLVVAVPVMVRSS